MKKNKKEGSFLRLFKIFATPYLLQLGIGIIAGLLVGSSIFGTLIVSYRALEEYNVALPVDDGDPSKQNPNATTPPVIVTEKPVEDQSTKKTQTITERALDKGKDKFDFLDKIGDFVGIKIRNEQNHMTTWGMALCISLVLLGFLLKEIATYVSGFSLRWVGASVVRDIRNKTFAHLQHQSLAFYSKQDVGKLISRCTNDIGAVESAISNTVADICVAPATIFGSCFFILIIVTRLNLVPLVLGAAIFMPLCIIPITILSKRLKKKTRETYGRIAKVVSRMHENFTCIQLIKAYFMEAEEERQFCQVNNAYVKTILKAFALELLMKPTFEFVAILLSCAFLFLCYLNGVSLTDLAILGFAGQTAYKPLKQMAQINTNLQKANASSERIFEILDTDTEIVESPNAVDLTSFEHSIEFKNVSFKYNDEGVQVLKNISIKINKGDVVAFVGSTGSGKSTIANLLARFYDPCEGEVLIDGYNLRDVKISSLRRLIGIVSQNTIMFNNTIRYNVLYGSPNATEEQMITATKQANAHDFIMNEKEGYDREVGDKGVCLSGGQKQRLAIARAILRNPPILILDEATSALDTVTEQQVQEAINHVMKERTVFAIAHRLSTIRNATCIYVLEHGEIVEYGTHEELLAQKGQYAHLCEMQHIATQS